MPLDEDCTSDEHTQFYREHVETEAETEVPDAGIIAALRKRVSELERDVLAAIATKNKELAEQEHARAEKAEADLDAALDLVLANEKGISLIASEITDMDIELLKPWRDLMMRCRDEWRASPNYQHIKPLLEARKEARRG